MNPQYKELNFAVFFDRKVYILPHGVPHQIRRFRESRLQVKECGEQFAATDDMTQARAEANKEYMKHLKITRIALKDDLNAAKSLGLGGRRKESFSGWLNQARTYYANLLSNASFLAAMAKYGITQVMVETAQAQVKDTETKIAIQLQEKGEAQAATEARDQALDDLMEWVSELVAIARIALEDQPQYLETLGILEPS